MHSTKNIFGQWRAGLVLALGLTTALSHAGGTKVLNIGDPAPALKVGKWLKGTPVSKFEKGKVYVVEFWATWCGPCKAAMPHLSELAKKYQGQVTFSGVSVWERGDDVMKRVQAFVKDAGDKMSYNVAADTADGIMGNTWLRAAGESGIPCSFIVGKEGKIEWIGHPMKLDEALPKVLAGTEDFKTLQETRAKKAPGIVDGETETLSAFQTAMNNKDYPGAAAAIDAGIAKNPELEKKLWFQKLQALVHFDDEKARKVAQDAVAGPDKAPGMLLNRLKVGATLAMAEGLSKATYAVAEDCLKKVAAQGSEEGTGATMAMHVNVQAVNKMLEVLSQHASKAKG